MERVENAALIALAGHRCPSFAEAAEGALRALEDTVAGTIALARFDSDAETCRVTDVAGRPIEGLERGITLQLPHPGEGWLDPELLRGAGIASSLCVPLEISDGNVVGLLCAFAAPAGAYGDDELALLTVAARLLGHEWESVRRRAENQQLRDRLRDDDSDADTGLAKRDRFVELLDREWRLAKRSSVSSIVVACEVAVDAGGKAIAAPIATLALKDAAEVLVGSARTTDHLGRVGATTLAAALVGCNGPEGADAFIDRLQSAVARVSAGRPFSIELSCAYHDLEQAADAGEALKRAEGDARGLAAGSTRSRATARQEAQA